MKPVKKIKKPKIPWRRNILRFQSMRSMLKLNKILAHQSSLVQNLQWREWKLSSKKLSKKTKKTLKIPIKKLTNNTLKLLIMMKSFHQNHPWARLPACKLNLHKRSSLVSSHQRVFLLKLLSYLKMKTELILPIFLMLIPMLSIMGNLFAEKFLVQLLSFQIWVIKTNSYPCQLPKRKHSKLTKFLDNTIERNCLLPMKTEP